MRKTEGITLIALVITIIVLLILAGVAISMLSGENGILKQAANAKTETEKQSTLEQIKLATVATMTNKEHSIKDLQLLETALAQQGLNNATVKESAPIGYIVKVGNDEFRITRSGDVKPIIELKGNQGKVLNEKENTLVKDENSNIIVVPAGFGVITGESANTAAKGLVISDDFENGTSIGNEFVWIPVGKVYTTTDEEKTAENTKTINLARCVFKSNGSIMEERTQKEPSGKLFIEETINEDVYLTDPKAESFKISSEKNGGYYIGRYEAGIEGTKDNASLETSTLTDGSIKPLCKRGIGVWDNINKEDAWKVSKAMYNNTNFTSDLTNSLSWDTTIIFIQKLSGDNYARQTSLNTDEVKATGESGDVRYNIYDLASNILEWSTETYTKSKDIARGGFYLKYYTSGRWASAAAIPEVFGFRPIIYLN